MKRLPFAAWCSLAVHRIRYRPDRKEVYAELYAHMEDQYEELIDAGCSGEEAEREVLIAMGDAEETARQLERVCRPFWGRALLILRLMIFGVLLCVLFSGMRNTGSVLSLFRPLVDGERFAVAQWLPQDAHARCGAYTLRLTRAAFAEDRESGEICLLLELRTCTFDPFLGQPLFVVPPVLEDSWGRVYPAEQRESRDLVFTGRRLLTVRLEDRSAEWAALVLRGPEGPRRFTVRLAEGNA